MRLLRQFKCLLLVPFGSLHGFHPIVQFAWPLAVIAAVQRFACNRTIIAALPARRDVALLLMSPAKSGSGLRLI
jgi:hypothetical protein